MAELQHNRLHQILQLLDYYYQFLYSNYFSRLESFNNYEKFLLINALIFAFFILKWLLSINYYQAGVNFFFKLPFVKNKLKQQLSKSKQQFLDSYPKQYRSQIKKIPHKPLEIQLGNQSQKQSTKGYLSGSRYPDKKHSDFIITYSKQFSYSNPLHFDLHPHVRQMEVQVIKMCAKMLNFFDQKKQAVGGFYSGGTESILLAILAYRQYGFNHRNIKNPNLVICTTGHAAALKAAGLFGIQIRFVETDINEQMSIKHMKKQIDSNTVCVYTSYPNYPYGTVDPIEKIAPICLKKKIPVHVDMCLGGFLVPFLKKPDNSPQFQVPEGVTSISLDCHKYGLSAKGSSILLFSSQKYRRGQLFATSQWPGGLYATIGIAGSRSGATIASAWISMMKMGVKGYTKNAILVREAVKKLAEQLRKLGYKVFGNPDICCIGLNHPDYNIGQIKEKMKEKGWDIPIIQKPMALHYSFTPLNSLKVDDMIKSFKEVTASLKGHEKNKMKAHKGTELQVYGICSKIPDTSSKKEIMKMLLQCFLEI